jgi:hypothetical protein
MKYDDYSWHIEGDFPAKTPEENGATHIGMFLGWAIFRNKTMPDLISNRQAEKAFNDVKNRKITPRNFLIKYGGGVILSDYFTNEMNEFVQAYYEKYYFDDYEIIFSNNSYKVANTWDNFDRAMEMLDKRYKEWNDTKQFKKKMHPKKLTFIERIFGPKRRNK